MNQFIKLKAKSCFENFFNIIPDLSPGQRIPRSTKALAFNTFFIHIFLVLFLFVSFSHVSLSQNPGCVSKSWVSDQGDGTYKNPILYADYSDPDVIRVGEEYYMVSSSFNCVPGLPILRSADLVNWELIGHALLKLQPFDVFDKPQHGNGIWAPCIRYFNNEFYIYYPDPDYGIFLVKASNPAGPWSEPVLVKGGKGLIDPSPLWDDDGKAYLVYAFAGSRAGIKSVLMVCRMNNDGTKSMDENVMVFDGHKAHPTVEGPKFYKRNSYYYIFAPAGGVKPGWQLVLRSKNIYGPYEERIVLAQGNTLINGPHQGAWVTTPTGENWFIHFQDKEAYGRIVHLQPMKWVDNWPVIGSDPDGDGVGEPVLSYKKPFSKKKSFVVTPPETDEFNAHLAGLQWQWFANPSTTWGFASGNLGFFRLNCIPKPESFKNLWDIPNLWMQKFPAEKFTATTKLTFSPRKDGEEIGFLVMGEDYCFISLKQVGGNIVCRLVECKNASTGKPESEIYAEKVDTKEIYFRIEVNKGALCSFSYSSEGNDFKLVGDVFQAKPGRWIGAKIGYFALREGITNDSGSVDIDWFRIE
jgi:beta-xylosidase